MVIINQNLDLEKVDFSFVPSLRCNLKCSFCSYNAGPDNDKELAIALALFFLETVDWDRIGSWGFYGGEPSINMEMYQAFINLIPSHIPRFVITNGKWTANNTMMDRFLGFCVKNGLFIVISGTDEHKRYQNAEIIKLFEGLPGVKIKDDDVIHPMGRATKETWACSRKCLTHPQPIRLAMFPGGHIALQNCDGVYPIVGSFADTFNDIFTRAVEIRKRGCDKSGMNINDVLR
jgi:hypothetical protein